MSQLCSAVRITGKFHSPSAQKVISLHGTVGHLFYKPAVVDPIARMDHIIVVLFRGIIIRVIRQDKIDCRNKRGSAIGSGIDSNILYPQLPEPGRCCQGCKPHAHNDNVMLFCHNYLHFIRQNMPKHALVRVSL